MPSNLSRAVVSVWVWMLIGWGAVSPLRAASAVSVTINGTLDLVSGNDPITLDGQTFKVTTEVQSNATQNACPGGLPLTTCASYTGLTVRFFSPAEAASPITCSNATASITNNATGADTIAISNCSLVVFLFQ